MAKNFRVCTKRKDIRSLSLLLSGDFDASAACELICRLDKAAGNSRKIAIDTDGLRTVNAFGLDVFIPRMNRLNHRTADIEVTGRFSEVFKE
ncbi:hypothetical protein DSCA_05870 [Desulfosarcina alkanivorans]|uniref:STAS domain-containing protein n=1 Tax=Desulfosarcina alkanivorans TaxID=571177 RepID=A0A5K7YPV2_9BACT|nr:hypothetical protein [Desulfosarcina alkanivorans]BBO66657.1 hypothetical protein DSCA_05870 [Desulfosarcina alkanivorans]